MKRYIRSARIADSFPDEIFIEMYPQTHRGYIYKKDYLHEGGGCYYHSAENNSPVDGCFVSLYPDGHLTYLWNGVEKPLNRDWKEITNNVSAASMTPEELVDAVYNNKPFDRDSYDEYAEAFHQPAEGAIKAKDIKIGDIIRNTESAEELDLDDIFVVKKITKNAPGWEDWDYTFTVKVMTLKDRPTVDIHYEANEYVGVDASGEEIHEF